MAPPPFSDSGQPESYTSSLLPGSGEQSSPMSDFTTEMDPFLTLPLTSQESHEPLSRTGSLGQVSAHPLLQAPRQQQQKQDQRHYSRSPKTENLNTPTPMVTTATLTAARRPYYQPRSQQMWHTAPCGEDLDHFSYDDSPTCGSGTSSSNFSPDSSAVTWPSPATSFQQPAGRPSKDTWGDLSISTPVSVDGCSGSASDILPLPDNGIRETEFDVDRAEWHCEPLGTAALPNFAGMAAATSCPASPTGLSLSTSAYPIHAGMDSPAGQFDLELESCRASEPPTSGPGAAAEQQIPYAQLIYKALMQAPNHSMSLQEIYQWFQENTDKCKAGQRGWMNSIRHNLSMNAGFVKRDRKREAESSIHPEADDAQSNGDPKKSTEWTLTDEAIGAGIQSTTRYRNKKSDGRDRDRGHQHNQHRASYSIYPPSSHHSLRHGISANRTAAHRNNEFPSRVSKAHRHGGMGPDSGFIARTSSPYYQDAFMAQAMAEASQRPMKLEPGLTTLPPPPSTTAGPEAYGLMVPEQHHAMMHAGSGGDVGGTAFDIPSSTPSHVPSMYLGPPPQPPQGPFPYDTTDVNLGYPGATEDSTDASRSARFFDATNMHDGFCDWSNNEPGYEGWLAPQKKCNSDGARQC